MGSFSNFIGETATLVGHNIIFDLKFLHYAGCSVINSKRKYFDTLQLAKKAWKDGSYRLDNLMRDELQIQISGLHDAKYDCFATGALFSRLCKIITNE